MTTWTPKAEQAETWTAPATVLRVFDPAVFARDPVFDTGSNEGFWDEKSRQAEVWTVV